MKKNEMKKIENAINVATSVKELREVINENIDLFSSNGKKVPNVAISAENLRINMLAVLNKEKTVDQLLEEKATMLKKARENKKESYDSVDPILAQIEEVKNCKNVKNLEDLISYNFEEYEIPLKKKDFKKKDLKELKSIVLQGLRKALKENKIEDQESTKESSKKETSKKESSDPDQKLFKKANKLTTKKECKKFIEKHELNVKTKGKSFEELQAAILLLISGNTTKGNKPNIVPSTNKILTAKDLKTFVPELYYKKGSNNYILLSILVKNAKKVLKGKEKPITLESLFNKGFDQLLAAGNYEYKNNGKSKKLKEKHRQQMIDNKNGFFTTARVFPKIVDQNIAQMLMSGSGLERSFTFKIA